MASSFYSDVTPVLVFEDWLFVGSELAAANITELYRHGITHVFSAIGPPKITGPGITYGHVLLSDVPSQNLEGAVDVFMNFILNARKKRGKVLVHCHAGISRSVSLILIYMILARNISPESGLVYIRKRRPQACPNMGFMAQLQKMFDIAKAF